MGRRAAIAAAACVGLAAIAVTTGVTFADWSDVGVLKGQQARAWVPSTPPPCTQAVDESGDKHGQPVDNVNTASCTLTITNHEASALTLDLAVDTSSWSAKTNPFFYFDGSPSTIPPAKSTTVPDYSGNLYITDSNGGHFGFGSLTCNPAWHTKPNPKPAHGTCSSSLTTPGAVTLAPGHSDTFTVTVHLNHGGHNGSTLTVNLNLVDGGGTMGTLNTTFALS